MTYRDPELASVYSRLQNAETQVEKLERENAAYRELLAPKVSNTPYSRLEALLCKWVGLHHLNEKNNQCKVCGKEPHYYHVTEGW